MKCTKCGKEIPDGDQKLCDDCLKKLQEELNQPDDNANVEKDSKKEKKVKETKAKEPKAKTKETKVKESKVDANKEDKKSGTIVAVIAIVAIAVLVAAIILIVNNFSNADGLNNVGNSIGNIRNYGYTASKGNTIYFLSPNEDSSKVCICSIKKNGEDRKVLYTPEESEDIVSINVLGDYIYFIKIVTDSESETDGYDNSICKMKLDGSNFEIINNNDFSNDCYEIYVIDDSIYYINQDNNIAKMNLDGSNKQVIIENGTGYLGITDKYIIYNVDNEDSSDYITYISNLDGSNARPIIENTRLYSVNISSDDYIYYSNEDLHICKTKLDSNVSEDVANVTAYNLNYYKGNLYYLNYKDADNETNPDYKVCVYKVSVDGGDPIILKELEEYSSYLNVAANGVVYMDNDGENGFINYINVDSKEEIKLYNLNYEEYYANEDTEETEEEVEETTENTEEVTEDVTENVVVENAQ